MKSIDIFSRNSHTFKTFLKLTRARGVKKHRMALVSGPKQIHETIQEFPERCKGLIFSEDHPERSASAFGPIPGYRLGRTLFRQIDLFDTRQPVLVVDFASFPRLGETQWPLGCTLCIPFQDPANVGSAVRAAAAFGVSQVVILKEAAHPFHPKALRAAGSNIFRVPLVEGPGLGNLGATDIPLIALSPKGEDIFKYPFPPTFCMVPGLEGPGIPQGLKADALVAIPMKNGVESLNAAMATGIALSVWRNRERN